MPDLESVIHSFDCCENSPCEDCAYYNSMDETSCGWRLISDAVALLKVEKAAIDRIKAKIAEINPDVEGKDGAEFDIGCIQGLRWALQEIEEEVSGNAAET